MAGIFDLLPMMAFGEPAPQQWQPQSFNPPQPPQQPPMDMSAQQRPQQQANPMAALFGGGGGQGPGATDIMSALGMALMLGSGDPNYVKVGAAMSGQQAKTKQTQQQQRDVYQWLRSQGQDHGAALAASRDPALLRSMVDAKDTPDIKNFEYAKKQGFKGTFEQFKQQQRAGAGEYGLQPQWGVDAQGNPVMLQVGKSGEAIKSKLPEGVRISNKLEKMDLGDKWGWFDPIQRSVVHVEQKNLAGAEAQRAQGKAQGEAAAQLPSSIAEAERAVKEIDQLMDHKGLDSIVGPLDQYRPNWTMGAEGRDALARYNQLKGRAFLQAYATLKGGGQITEIEGIKAENAMARMDRSQSEAEFKTALRDFRDAVQVGMQKLRERAGGQVAPQATPQQSAPQRLRFNPQTGDFE